MRLINTVSLRLHSFVGEDVEEYAILSHTWGASEVTFQDMTIVDDKKLTRIFAAARMSNDGYSKIKYCCEKARSMGIKWAWVDTCCIDKTSSSELSEAINAMFRWYKKAKVCFVYMPDVRIDPNSYRPVEGMAPDVELAFKSSRWWTRGWTLQELLAPDPVIFFDVFWEDLGTKSDHFSLISSFTNINFSCLLNPAFIYDASVACRMSWAANRVTTREEDIAYCLLGIFNVNMPLLYGEGEKAFARLQEQIIQNTDDHSVFAWDYTDGKESMIEDLSQVESLGLLARHPSMYSFATTMSRFASHSEYAMTNKGLRIRLPLFVDQDGTILAILNCGSDFGWDFESGTKTVQSGDLVAIPLQRAPDDQNSFYRLSDGMLRYVYGFHRRLACDTTIFLRKETVLLTPVLQRVPHLSQPPRVVMDNAAATFFRLKNIFRVDGFLDALAQYEPLPIDLDSDESFADFGERSRFRETVVIEYRHTENKWLGFAVLVARPQSVQHVRHALLPVVPANESVESVVERHCEGSGDHWSMSGSAYLKMDPYRITAEWDKCYKFNTWARLKLDIHTAPDYCGVKRLNGTICELDTGPPPVPPRNF